MKQKNEHEDLRMSEFRYSEWGGDATNPQKCMFDSHSIFKLYVRDCGGGMGGLYG